MRSVEEALAAAGLPPLTRTAWVEVDTDQLTENARQLATFVSPLQLGVVVKADGYGHGLEVAARCAVRGGAAWLCTATLEEAVRLRNDGYEGRVFVLYPVPGSQGATAGRLGIDVSVGSVVDLRRIDRVEGLAVHVEIDTGMTRGGCLPEVFDDVVAAVLDSSARLAGVWTHLASPEDPSATEQQLAIFSEVTAPLPPDVLRHTAASGGILATDLHGQHLVRAGLVYYGYHPGTRQGLPPGVAPALQIKAHPVRVVEVEVGTGVGYASTWRASRRSRIATLPLGYADGWSRLLSPGASALAGGRRVPLVGRISSDAITVDVTDLPSASDDTEMCLVGSQGGEVITADEVAGLRGSISWEVLQQLHSRLPRVYVAGGQVVGVRGESVRDVAYVDPDILAYPA